MFRAVEHAMDVINGIDTSESLNETNDSCGSIEIFLIDTLDCSSEPSLPSDYSEIKEVKLNVSVENIPVVSDILKKVEELEEVEKEVKIKVKRVIFFISFLDRVLHHFTLFFSCSSKRSIEITLESSTDTSVNSK